MWIQQYARDLVWLDAVVTRPQDAKPKPGIVQSAICSKFTPIGPLFIYKLIWLYCVCIICMLLISIAGHMKSGLLCRVIDNHIRCYVRAMTGTIRRQSLGALNIKVEPKSALDVKVKGERTSVWGSIILLVRLLAECRRSKVTLGEVSSASLYNKDSAYRYHACLYGVQNTSRPLMWRSLSAVNLPPVRCKTLVGHFIFP